MAAEEPDHSSQGAQLVGALLKVWPAKEAPLAVQIAFYEELQRAVEPYKDEGRDAGWFRKLDRELSQSLVPLRRLAAQQVREAQKAKERLDGVVSKVPLKLRRTLRQAKP